MAWLHLVIAVPTVLLLALIMAPMQVTDEFTLPAIVATAMARPAQFLLLLLRLATPHWPGGTGILRSASSASRPLIEVSPEPALA